MAELAAHQQTMELAHTLRLSTVGEMTAAISHEINQPLGAILSNAEAAEMLLDSGAHSTDQLRHILADIRRDDLRASESCGAFVRSCKSTTSNGRRST